MLNRTLIISVFVVASCGLAYELIAGALSSYLLGDSVLQFSTVIGCYLFAMGAGSYLSRFVKDEDVLSRFIDIELLVGLLGGISAAVLFLVFGWLAAPFRAVLYAIVFLIGVLVGMEIPLVMRALNTRRAQFSELVSRVLTFDYLGALAVSLVFPLLLAPKLGLTRTGFLFGILNTGVALWAAYAFREQIAHAAGRAFRGSLVLGLLIAGFGFSDRLTNWGEKGLFGDEIIAAHTTPYQRLVITRWKDDVRLYINGNLQFSSRDEHRYHEALIHPGLEQMPWARTVLVLGGGDGLAVREILKHRNVQHVTLVDIDPAMTRMFSTADVLTSLNARSLTDARVKLINADAVRWLEGSSEMFDFIVSDFPDPSSFALGKLYSVPMYRLLAKHLSAHGYVVVQSTSPYFAPHAYWCVNATLKEAGFHTWPYHAYVPSFGEWGFILAGLHRDFSLPAHYSVATRFLDAQSTRLMFEFPPDMQPIAVEPNWLNTQTLVHYFEQDWGHFVR